MNSLLKFEFSEFSFLGIIVLAVLLALIFKLVNHTILRRVTNQRIRNFYPLLEVMIWFSFLLWGINILLKESIYRMIAILSLGAVIIAGLGWFVIRDLLAGSVLRFSDSFFPGQYFQLGQYSGRIKRAGLLSLAMLCEDGTLTKIPWSKITGQIYSKGSTDDVANRQRFPVEVPQKYSLNVVHSKIREAVLLSVGAALNKEPQIKLVGNARQAWQLEITAYALSPEYFHIIESNVKDVIDKLQS